MVSAYEQERKGFWHEPGGRSTSEAIALETWARAAHELLVETAERYHGVVTEDELTRRVQDDSGIHTTRGSDRWLTKLLAPLAVVHHRSGEPPLTALVVDDRGWVGERYDELLRAAEQLPITEVAARERHAARARLLCYQWAGSAPGDGGLPAEVVTSVGRRRAPGAAGATTTPRTARAPRAVAPAAPKRVAASDRPVTVCPSCFMAIPATGICDNCG